MAGGGRPALFDIDMMVGDIFFLRVRNGFPETQFQRHVELVLALLACRPTGYTHSVGVGVTSAFALLEM
jgi:hypothetical protein